MKEMIIKTVKRVVNDSLSLLYPSSCSVCDNLGEREGVCRDCLDTISYIPDDRCRKCGKLIEPYSGEQPRCN